MIPPSHPHRNSLWLILLLIIAVGHGLIATQANRGKSTTSDEIVHITGGYTFNRWNDYRLHPENGVLPQRWQTLPLLVSGIRYPEPSDKSWQQAYVWEIGHRFFYQCGNRVEWMLGSARAMNAVFGVATLLLVAAWARHLFGWAGVWPAALLCALSPTMLAHSALATSDMAMTFFLLAAVSAWWWHLQDGRWFAWVVSALTFGLACVAKYTSVLLPFMFLAMVVLRAASPRPLRLGGRTFGTLGGRLAAMTASLLGHGVVAALVIWAFFGFRYTAFNPALPGGGFIIPWAEVLSLPRAQAAVIAFCRDWHLLPEGYTYGLAYVLKSAEARSAYLDGAYSATGWASFFPKAFLYKTTPALLLTLAASAGFALLQGRANRGALGRYLWRTIPLLVLFGFYWGASLSSHLNIGHRHILPTYPVLFIFCGLVGWAAQRAWRQSRLAGTGLVALGAGLIGWQAGTALQAFPHYLAYFSPVAGGSAQGYKHLVDSSLDWGQDLPGLKQWLDRHRRAAEPVYLSYFGTGDSDYYKIDAVQMPTAFPPRRVHPWYWLEPGIYAISATMLSHVYSPWRGDWTPKREDRYQTLRALDPDFHALKDDPHGHPELFAHIPAEKWAALWDEYDKLRFARLCHYLRVRTPDDNIGYSILIYRLSREEIEAATGGSLAAWAGLIERSASTRR